MKRKLNAILALILAVMMIVPSAVVVTAAPDGLEVSVSGASLTAAGDKILDPASVKTTTTAPTASQDLYLTNGGTITLNVAAVSGWKVYLSTTNNNAVIFTGTEVDKNGVMTGSGNITVTGDNAAGKTAKLVLTAKKSGQTDQVITLNFTLVANKIIGMDAVVDVALDGDVYRPKHIITDSDYYFTESVIKVTGLNVYYNDKAAFVNGTLANLKMGVGSTKAESKANLAAVTSVEVFGGDEYLTLSYIDANGHTFERTYELDVQNSNITGIDVYDTPDVPLASDAKVTADILASEIGVIATYDKAGSGNLSYNDKNYKAVGNYTFEFWIDKNCTQADTTIDENTYFSIKSENFDTAKNQTKKSWLISDYITFGRDPKDVDIEWLTNSRKTYADGMTLGDRIEDWDNVRVTVHYTDGPHNCAEDKCDVLTVPEDIAALKMVITPFDRGTRVITVKTITSKNVDVESQINLPNDFDITENKVVKMEISKADYPTKMTYQEGDTLDLTGLDIHLTYENGNTVTRTYNSDYITVVPAQGTTLTEPVDISVTYKNPETGITLNETIPASAMKVEPAGVELSDVVILNSGRADYYVGESFDTADYVILFVYENSDIKTKRYDLKDVVTTKSFPAYTGKGSLVQKVGVKDPLTGTVTELEISVSVTVRPILDSITVETTKTRYLAGETPAVADFEIMAKYNDGSSRLIKVASGAAGSTLHTATFTESGVTYTITLSPSTMDEGDTKIVVSLKEKITNPASTTTKTAEVAVTVDTPACILTTYTKNDSGRYYYKQTPYENFEDALADAVSGDEIKLMQDVTMSADYSSSKTLTIDMNGNSLTMIRGELYVYSKAASNITITFTNTAKNDGTLIYTTNANDNIIIRSGKDYVIDRNSQGAGKYEVTITATKNGKVTGPDEVTHGNDAKFTITPDKGYEINTVRVNNKTKLVDEDGILTIENVEGDLTITVTFKEEEWDNPFKDVYKSADYYDAVAFVYDNGLFNGTSATTFEPHKDMTRAMFVTVLGRLAGVDVSKYKTSSFPDVKDTVTINGNTHDISWAIPYIEWATSIGLVEGYEDGTFRPTVAINHNEMYVLMQRYAGLVVGVNTSASGIVINASDEDQIPTWARAAVQYAVKNKFTVTSGYNLLKPEEDATRGELAQLLQKFCVNILDMEG
ncbi:MAG: S-layer homology domain-containing protein [Ruminococcaceae bacterium]|nr:S-layer homology domain-containing protein [Oscillospiraceae bacterium]